MTNSAEGSEPGADEMMTRIGQAIALGQGGERESARLLYAELWAEIGATGDPLHRCALAHSMADVQDDPREELAWDLLALAAADELTDTRLAAAGIVSPIAGFYPSLHLNLGEGYRKLGDLPAARRHLALGQAAVTALGQDGYARMIKSGLDALGTRLGP